MTTIITSPFEPKPELQTEEGVQSYLAKLSKLSRSDLCIELCSVMAAKHNSMMMPAGLNEYSEKQAIVTDLTDKATAICIFEFGQAPVFGFAGGDLSQLNELINSIDEGVAQQNLEPEEHGSMILHKLSEIFRPESNDDDSWLEDLLNESSETISNEDYELLKESPFIIFILMALADGEIDLKETTALTEIILNPQMFQNNFLVQLIRDAIPEISATSIPERLAPIMENNPDYAQKLNDLARVIDSSLDAKDAMEFKKALVKLGYKIADASGGLFGLGSRVCKQEKQMLRKIALILGVSGV
jgi:uncharacterized tellurite resistance protein B-like protein